MFIPPMLCTSLRDPNRLNDPNYIAEPKFDGQRAQIHVKAGRTVAAYSRRGLPLPRHPGLAWLCDVRWPVERAVLDGEVCGTTGSDGIQAAPRGPSTARCRDMPSWRSICWPLMAVK
jgi:ATP-dependent DNA ligase